LNADRPAWYRWEGEVLVLSLRVPPKSHRDEIIGPWVDAQGYESLKLRITAAPVDGKANAHLIKFLAQVFGVAKSRVCVVSGQNGRQKRVHILALSKLPPTIRVNV